MIKLAVPVQMVTKRGRPECRTVPEDSPAEVAQCVRAVLATERGRRLELPTFGIDDPAFVGAELPELRAAIAEWEPRADVLLDEQLEGITQEVGVALR